jgi:hypothetical protein
LTTLSQTCGGLELKCKLFQAKLWGKPKSHVKAELHQVIITGGGIAQPSSSLVSPGTGKEGNFKAKSSKEE